MTAAAQIGLAILIPDRTGVFPFLYSAYEMERGPRTTWIFGGGHIKTFLWCTEENIVLPVVKAD
jgi:hypothetical protein